LVYLASLAKAMDEIYRQIAVLTGEYIQLNSEFIDALNRDRPSEELTALKEKIKSTLEEIERLEKIRSTSNSGKDSLPLE
jgi:Ni,Fe-hydrogenase III large subunit